MSADDGRPQTNWEDLHPVIDDAMHDLVEKDRVAILVRFFEQRSLAEVGEVLGVGENAARMRVDRALHRLRELLTQRGIKSTTMAVGAALTAALRSSFQLHSPRP